MADQKQEENDLKKGLIQVSVGSLIILILYLIRRYPITEEYVYIYFLIGAFGLILCFIGFVRSLCNIPIIFQWVRKKFGLKFLAIVVLIFAVLLTGMAILITIIVFTKKEFHVRMMVISIVGAITLWYTFFRTLKIMLHQKKVKNKDYDNLSNYNRKTQI